MTPKTLSFGRFDSFAHDGHRALAHTSRATLEIAAHPAGPLRVRIGRGKRLPPYESAAVSGTPSQSPLQTTPAKTGATLRTPHLTASLQFDPLSISFSHPKRPAFAADRSLSFQTINGQPRIVVRKAYAPTDHVYGLGQKTGWLDKRGRKYKMRNTDVWLENPGLGQTTDPLYASFPFFIVHNPKHTYGIFLDNPEYTEFDFSADDYYEFSAPAEALTYYVLPGPALPQVLAQYAALTGHMPLPALWALGFHQCRWGYASEADIRRVTSELRARRIPADGIWLDIDYMDGYRVFTWDRADFPRPRELMADLRRDGFHAITIVDPGVKVDEGYRVYAEGRAGDHFVKHADGREYNGSVWPGPSAFPDFHRAETRQWWAGLVREWVGQYGLSGLWNDMNEPASTDLSGSILDARHNGQPHTTARNTYALQMARATHAGLLAHDPDSRPFILTRAAFSGAQAVTALWCGDNSSQWEHLASSIPMLLNLGLSGMPFVGVDIGGFGENCTAELLARWTQAGVFYPFCRNHAAAGTRAQEPWAFGRQIESICRRYIGLRYQLLPYFYSLFEEAARTAAPIMRPLAWHYPSDRNTLNLNDQFMVGRDLIVAPILTPGGTGRGLYLPKGTWYRWGADEAFTGPAHIAAPAALDELPLFVRGGAIVPMWPLAQHTEAIRRQEVTLHLWPGAGEFELYEDDGRTRAFERGPEGWRRTRFSVRPSQGGLRLTIDRPQGRYSVGRKQWKVAVHRPAAKRVTIDGRPVPARLRAGALRFAVPDDGDRHVVTLG